MQRKRGGVEKGQCRLRSEISRLTRGRNTHGNPLNTPAYPLLFAPLAGGREAPSDVPFAYDAFERSQPLCRNVHMRLCFNRVDVFDTASR
jgi:hypothetical protein